MVYLENLNEFDVSDVEDGAFAIFCRGHETFEFGFFADSRFGQRFRCGAKGEGAKLQLHFSALPGFDLIRLMGELQIECWDACRCVALLGNFRNAGREHKSIQGLWPLQIRQQLRIAPAGLCELLRARLASSWMMVQCRLAS